jgi:glycosyltransferase involved in cell wall biosynthesis
VHLFQSLGCGGTEKRALELCRFTAARGCEHRFLAAQPGNYFADECAAEGIPVIYAPAARFADAILSLTPDVLHVHYWGFGGWWAQVVPPAHACPPILETVHNRTPAWVDERVRRIVLVSHHGTGPQPERDERFTVIYAGVDTQAYRPLGRRQEARRALSIPPGAAVVGRVARLELDKAEPAHFLAYLDLAEAAPEVAVVIVGDGSFRGELEGRVAARGLSSRFVFTGWRKDASFLMEAFDVLMHTTRDEPFGGVIVEALAKGLPVVASAAGAIPEVLGDPPAGILAASTEAAVKATIELVRDPARQRFLTAAALQRAGLFDARRTAEQYWALYRELAGREADAAPAEAGPPRVIGLSVRQEILDVLPGPAQGRPVEDAPMAAGPAPAPADGSGLAERVVDRIVSRLARTDAAHRIARRVLDERRRA